jgi:hypothetical protein
MDRGLGIRTCAVDTHNSDFVTVALNTGVNHARVGVSSMRFRVYREDRSGRDWQKYDDG